MQYRSCNMNDASLCPLGKQVQTPTPPQQSITGEGYIISSKVLEINTAQMSFMLRCDWEVLKSSNKV